MRRNHRGRPKPKELLAAYEAMDQMSGWAFKALHEEGLTSAEFTDIWGGWVEAKRQIAIATHWLIQKRNDPYHRAWMRMLNR